jgi:hypothetical protein
MTRGSASKMRCCQRRSAILALTLIVDLVGSRAERPASTLDLSPYRLGVNVSFPLVPRQIVEVVPREGAQYSIRGRVIGSRR